jgi:hypothetical protein
MEVETETKRKPIYCNRCAKFLADEIEDGVCLKLGHAHFFDTVRFSCSCHRPMTWHPKPIAENETKGFEGETRKMLNNLGIKKKWANLGQQRRLKRIK